MHEKPFKNCHTLSICINIIYKYIHLYRVLQNNKSNRYRGIFYFTLLLFYDFFLECMIYYSFCIHYFCFPRINKINRHMPLMKIKKKSGRRKYRILEHSTVNNRNSDGFNCQYTYIPYADKFLNNSKLSKQSLLSIDFFT